MRVAIAFEYPTVSGGENSLLVALDWLLTGQRCRDLEVVGLCPPSGAVREKLRRLNLETYPFDRHAASSRDEQISRLKAAVTNTGVDLLHANSLSVGRLTGAAVDRLPCPSTAHLRDIQKLSRAAVRDLNQNRRLLAVSQATRDFHVRQGIFGDRCRVVYNGVSVEADPDSHRTVRRRVRGELGIPDNATVLLTVGQIGLRKGLDVLGEAACRLRPPSGTLHWLIAGERFSTKQESIDFQQRVVSLFKSAEPAVATWWLGFRDDVPDLMRASDVLVHGARQEPLGRVLLEAAAHHLPVVATDAGGTCEIFEHGKSALLIPPDDALAVVTTVTRLMTDPEQRRRLAAEAATQVKQRFSIDSSAQQLAGVWREVVQEK